MQYDFESALDPIFPRETRYWGPVPNPLPPDIEELPAVTNLTRMTYDGTYIWLMANNTIEKRSEATGEVLQTWDVTTAESGMVNIIWFVVRDGVLWANCNKGTVWNYFVEINYDTMTTISSTAEGRGTITKIEIYGDYIFFIIPSVSLLYRWRISTKTDEGYRTAPDAPGTVTFENLALHNDLLFCQENTTLYVDRHVYAFDPATWTYVDQVSGMDVPRTDIQSSWDLSYVLQNSYKGSVTDAYANAYTIAAGSPPTASTAADESLLIGFREDQSTVAWTSVAGDATHWMLSNYTDKTITLGEITTDEYKRIRWWWDDPGECQYVCVSDDYFWWAGSSTSLYRISKTVMDYFVYPVPESTSDTTDSNPGTLIRVGSEVFFDNYFDGSVQKFNMATPVTIVTVTGTSGGINGGGMVLLDGSLWIMDPTNGIDLTRSRFMEVDPATGGLTNHDWWVHDGADNPWRILTDETNLIAISASNLHIFDPADPTAPETTHSHGFTFGSTNIKHIAHLDGWVYVATSNEGFFRIRLSDGNVDVISTDSMERMCKSDNYIYASRSQLESRTTYIYKISDGTLTTYVGSVIQQVLEDDGNGIIKVADPSHSDNWPDGLNIRYFDENTAEFLEGYSVAPNFAFGLGGGPNHWDRSLSYWGGNIAYSRIGNNNIYGVRWAAG